MPTDPATWPVRPTTPDEDAALARQDLQRRLCDVVVAAIWHHGPRGLSSRRLLATLLAWGMTKADFNAIVFSLASDGRAELRHGTLRLAVEELGVIAA